jgi:hypothetical protein
MILAWLLAVLVAVFQASSEDFRMRHGAAGNATIAHVNLTYYGTNNPQCDGNSSVSVPRPSYILALSLDTCYPFPDLTFFCSNAGQCFDFKWLKSITRSQALFGMMIVLPQ